MVCYENVQQSSSLMCKVVTAFDLDLSHDGEILASTNPTEYVALAPLNVDTAVACFRDDVHQRGTCDSFYLKVTRTTTTSTTFTTTSTQTDTTTSTTSTSLTSTTTATSTTVTKTTTTRTTTTKTTVTTTPCDGGVTTTCV